MLIHKSYQSCQILQEFPNNTNTENKVFLTLYKQCRKYKRNFISVPTIASWVGVCERTVSRATNKFEEMGLITKTIVDRRCHYTITDTGNHLRPYIANAYRIATTIFLSIGLLSSLGDSSVPLLKLKGEETKTCYFPFQYFFKNPSPSLIHVIQSPTVRESYKQELIKKERSMQDRQSINDIKSLKLTQWGKIRLQAFSDRVIKYADNLVRASDIKKLKDPFSFFVSTCLRESARLGETPNQSLVQDLYKAHNAPADKQYTECRQDVDSSSATGLDGLDSVKQVGSLAHAGLASMASKAKVSSAEFTKQELTDIDRAYCGLKDKAYKFWIGLGRPEGGWNRFIPYSEYFRRNARTAQQAIEAIQSFDIAANVVVEQQGSITPKEKETLDRNFDALQNLRQRSNLNEFEKLAMVTLENKIEEAKRRWGLNECWNEQEWAEADKEIIAWSLSFLETMQNHWNPWYKDLKREVEAGPTSPRALTGELQEGLRLMKTLLEEGSSSNDAKQSTVDQAVHPPVGTDPVEEVRSEL